MTPEERQALLQARLVRARARMLKLGIKPLVRSERDQVNVGLRATWQRISVMSEPEKPATVTNLNQRRRK